MPDTSLATSRTSLSPISKPLSRTLDVTGWGGKGGGKNQPVPGIVSVLRDDYDSWLVKGGRKTVIHRLSFQHLKSLNGCVHDQGRNRYCADNNNSADCQSLYRRPSFAQCFTHFLLLARSSMD
jgi:hypothetical protein